MIRDVNIKLYAEASQMIAGLRNGERGIKRFASSAKSEFASIKNSVTSIEGKLASLGVTIGVTASIIQSANLDKELKLLELTAGATADETARLRKELFEAQKNYGTGVDDLKSGVDSLIAGGLNMKQATASVEPMAQTLAVAKTNAVALAQAMGVSAKQFDIDLSNPREIALLLDKMVVSGRAGNAELENQPDIFARIGGNAKKAGLDVDRTLALIETLSLVEPNADRLGTLADSTLRLFTNLNYLKTAQKATGIQFFDKEGGRRDPLVVLGEIKKRYDALKTDAQKFQFVGKAFGQSDQETIKGIQAMLGDNALTNLDRILKDVRNASGTVKRDLSDGLDNLPSQIARVSGALRTAADNFAQPINETLKNIIQWSMDKKENGGLGMDGNDMLMATGGGALATLLTARYGAKAISGIAGKISGLGTGIATGKALEEVAGVPSVFVVNMPDGGISGLPGMGKADAAKTAAGGTAARALLGSAALGALPLMAMWGVSSMAGDTSKDKDRASALLALTEKLNKIFSYDPDKAQREWRARKDQELKGDLQITVHDNRSPTVKFSSNQPNLRTTLANGPLMAHRD